MWSCVDEPVVDANDDDTIRAVAGKLVDLDLSSSVVATATALQLNFRATYTAGTTPCNLTASIKKSNGTTLTTSNPNITGSWANYSSSIGSLSLTQADVDGLYIELTPTGNCSLVVSAVDVLMTYSAPAGTVSGNVSDTSLCDGATPVVGIAVNGIKITTVPCAASKNGYFSASSTWSANQIITTYYDGVALKGAASTRTGATQATPVTGADVRPRTLSFGSQSASPVTVADLNVFDGSNDSDIPVDYSGSGALATGTNEVVVNVGTFAPGVDVTTPRIRVSSGGTLSGGSTQLTLSGSGKAGCYSGSTTTRPFCVSGTFTPGTGTVSYQATGSTTLVKPTTYYRLEVQGSATYYLGYTFDLYTGPFTMTTFTMSGSAYGVGFSTSPFTISGAMTVTGSATFSGSSTSITVGGDITGTGRIAGGDVELRSGSAQTINASGSSDWAFGSLTLSSTGARNVTIAPTSRGFTVGNLFAIGRTTDSANTNLVTTGFTQPMTTKDFWNTNHGGWNAAGTTLIMSGNFTNDSGLVGGGTVRFQGGTTSTYANNSTATHSSFEVIGGKTVLLASGFYANVSVTLQGTGGCGAEATLKSTVPGTYRHPISSGATIIADKAAFQDIDWNPVAFTATASSNLGHNTGITFTGSAPPCVGPSSFYENDTNAVFGTAHNAAINGRTAFHMSFVNNAGTADHYRTEISTTPLDASVLALYPLDSSGTDRSATSNAVVGSGGVAYGAGATNFGQAATFDGVDDALTAPANAAYGGSTFTVEAWIRASGYGSGTWPTIVSNSSPTAMHFQVGFNQSLKTLVADVTAGGSLFEIATPATPWLDNSWHHVAFTVDAAKTMTLYVDGIQYATGAYVGTLDAPSAPLVIGGSNGYATNAFQGQIDDVQLSNIAKTGAELAGYAKTLRPHAQSLWQSANYATSGAVMSSCVYGARCADVVYGGSGMHQEGARYYVTHQVYASSAVWTPATSDWFETSDAISITVPGSISIPSVGASSTVTTQFDADMTCSSSSACSLLISAPSGAAAMMHTDGHHFIPPYAPTPPSAWAAGGPAALGVTVLSATDDYFNMGKNAATWGSGTDFSDLSMLKFAGATPTSTTLYTSEGFFGTYPSSNSVTIGLRLDTNATTAGSFAGVITLVAVDTP
jgi:hypothetical protein